MTGQNPPASRRSTLLQPLAVLYGGLVRARNWRYERMAGASHAVDVPVISVGNLTVGGTGKTPLVVEIVTRLQAAGRQPAILTRGYAARPGQEADEVREFRLAVPNVPVVVNPNRLAGAAHARRVYHADCLVLDDGFQHRRLRRDLDIVLIDALDPWGGRRLLPAGRLREPLANLRRADWLIITRTNQVDPTLVQEIVAELHTHAPGVPVSKAAVAPSGFISGNGHVEPPAALAQHRVLPVCGIGNPTSFTRLVGELARIIGEPLIFPDHHHYSRRDAERIATIARQRQVECVVTTRKDWVKLSECWPHADGPAPAVKLYRLETRAVLADPRGEFDQRLRRLFEEHP
jgi:tetraacyldisaccharide 4'-kinase